MDDNSIHIRVSKRWARLAMVVTVTALIVAPLTALAAHTFTDVPDTNTFHADIAWLKDAGVTLGCNPPTNDEFCPKDSVTREQMSAFMRRLAENQVVDAATAVQAEDAQTLDGNSSSDFVMQGEANSVSSSMTSNEPGVAQTTATSGVALNAAPTSILSAEIEVPAGGYVMVHATWEAWAQHVNGTSDISQFDVSDTDGAFPEPNNMRNYIVASGSPSGTRTVVSASQRAFPVDSAGTYTFYLVGSASSGSVLADDIVLTLMYVPTAYGTVANSGSAGSGGADASN